VTDSPTDVRPESKAWLVLLLNAFYTVADLLCAAFVGVYFYVGKMDMRVVCYHYLALYLVTPIFFLLAGWYSQARDRVHVYRLGLALHAVYYGLLLYLGYRAPEHAVALGVLLGVTWGFYWAGANTFNYDVTTAASREYFFGVLSVVTGVSGLIAPLISGCIIGFTPSTESGYRAVFLAAVLLYLAAIVCSIGIPHDRHPRPYRLKRALFPGRDQRDWQLVMLSAATQAGLLHMFTFLLALLMYMETGSALSVGVFAALQGLASILSSYWTGRTLGPHNRKRCMFWGTAILIAAGGLITGKFTLATLIMFGFLRSVAAPLISIPCSGIRLNVIEDCAEESAQRIEYIAAWEVPLAMGRVLTLGLLLALNAWLEQPVQAIRAIMLFICLNYALNYLLVSRISRAGGEDSGPSIRYHEAP